MRIPSRRELILRTIRVLRRYGIRPSKRLSQHFVIDPQLIRDFIRYSGLSGREVVVEIGAGIGNLTMFLARVSRKVKAIEVDRRLVRVLRDEVEELYPNVEVIEADALTIDYDELGADVVVSNTPYSISSRLLFKLAEHEVERALMTFQREFASRLVAKPGTGDYGRLTVTVSLMYVTELLGVYPPSSFYPRPEVFTSLVRLTRKRLTLSRDLMRAIGVVARALFSERNKLVRTPLIRLLKASPDRVRDEVLQELSHVLSMRVYELTPEQVVSIARVLLDEGVIALNEGADDRQHEDCSARGGL